MISRARHIDVEPGQRELGGRVVIKLRSHPRGGVVTGSAGCREARRLVARVRRVVVVGEVAVGTGSTQARKLPADVALLARHADMEPGQREYRARIIEFGPQPLRGSMADRA